MREKKDPCALVLGITMENSMGFPQKLKLEIELPYNPESLLLYFSQKKNPQKQPKTLIQKDTWVLMFTAVLFIVSKIWKPPKRPSTGNG